MRPLWETGPRGTQICAELNEARGQLEHAIRIAEGREGNPSPSPPEEARDRWLLAHKLREAITNLEDCLVSLRKGLE